ncbi:unnamed protein product [Moneuplotes crassus]|uniref:Cyclic nucleotide-binding domain-containing protein n=2 Tax=Euplotes crassus TaxID=5936 RepID=A0AAD1X744_EUPCR|nr:unnamed protein product [Moneuplotes crassus]
MRPNGRKSSMFLNYNIRHQKTDIENIDKDVIPAFMQNTEMYAVEEIEQNYMPPENTRKRCNLCIDKLTCKSEKIEPIEVIPLEHDKERAKKNWKSLKSKLMNMLFMKRMIENAMNEKGGDDSIENDEKAPVVCASMIISPDSKRKKHFDYFISIVMIIDMFYNTYAVFVDDSSPMFNFLTIPFYLVQMYICCFSAYNVDEIVVNDIRIILRGYFKFEFFLDFLATAPFFLLTEKLLFFKLLRLLKLKACFGNIHEMLYIIMNSFMHSRKELIQNILTLIKFFTLFCYTVHALGCIWISIGRGGGDEGWVEIKSELLEDPSSHSDVYIAGIYWVVTTFTTVGYGDFSGNTNQEYILQMSVKFIGIGFFGYIIGNINFLIGQVDSIEELEEEKDEQNNLWLIRLARANASKVLTNDYYEHILSFFTTYWNLDYYLLRENEFFNQLKPRLQKEVANICFEPVYNRFEGFFSGLEESFKREIVHQFRFEEFKKFKPYSEKYEGDRLSFPEKQRTSLLKKNKIPEKVYFFTEGMAYASNATGRYIYFKLPEGSFFGETHVLSATPCSYSIFYDEEIGASALAISSEALLKICEQYPDSFHKLRERSEKRRKLFRYYKFEVISHLASLSRRKYTMKEDQPIITKMYSMVENKKSKGQISKYAKKRLIESEHMLHEKESFYAKSKSLRPINTPRQTLDSSVVSNKLKFGITMLNKRNSVENTNHIRGLGDIKEEFKASKIESLNEGFEDELPHIIQQSMEPDLCEISEENEIKSSKRYKTPGLNFDSDEEKESLRISKKTQSKKVFEEKPPLHLSAHQRVDSNANLIEKPYNLQSVENNLNSFPKFLTSKMNSRYSLLNSGNFSNELGKQRTRGTFETNQSKAPIEEDKNPNKDDSNDGKVLMHSSRSSNTGDKDGIYSGGSDSDEMIVESVSEQDSLSSRSGGNIHIEVSNCSSRATEERESKREYLKMLSVKGEFYSIQKSLYNTIEKEDGFQDIIRYTKLMDIPRRNELFEEFLQDEKVGLNLEIDPKEAIEHCIKKLKESHNPPTPKNKRDDNSFSKEEKESLVKSIKDTISKVDSLTKKFNELKAQGSKNKEKLDAIVTKVQVIAQAKKTS